MQITHALSLTVGDATGTATIWNGGTTSSIAATAVPRPTDWNAKHALQFTLAGNTTNASTVSGTAVPFAATGGLSIGGSNGSLLFSAPQAETWNYFNPQDGYVQVAGQQGQGSMHIQPMQAPNVSFDRIVFPVLFSGATNSTGSQTLSIALGIYTRNNSTLSLMSSWSTTAAVTHSGTANSSQNVGLKLLTMGATGLLPEDQYYVGIWSRTTSGGANASISQALASQQNSNFAGFWGAAVTASQQYTRGLGHFSATFSTALPNSVGLSQISGTASIVLRQPVFYFVNGTF